MALYECKDPFIVSEPKVGKYIDQQYVWDSLPLNRFQRKALFDHLTLKKPIDFDYLKWMSDRPLVPDVLEKEHEDYTVEEVNEQTECLQPTEQLHPNTSLSNLCDQDPCLNLETASLQTPPSDEQTCEHLLSQLIMDS